MGNSIGEIAPQFLQQINSMIRGRGLIYIKRDIRATWTNAMHKPYLDPDSNKLILRYFLYNLIIILIILKIVLRVIMVCGFVF